MEKVVFTSLYNSGPWQVLQKAINDNELPSGLFSVIENQKSYIFAGLKKKRKEPLLIIVTDYIKARELANDISGLEDSIECLVFPPRAIRLGNVRAISREDEFERIIILNKLAAGFNGVVIATIESVMTKIVPKDVFKECSITIKKGSKVDLKKLQGQLASIGYSREERAEGPAQFAQRGDILDVFNISDEFAIRIELFDDEIESIRYYDPATQRSVEKVDEVNILPAVETPLTDAAYERGYRALTETAKIEAEAKKNSANTASKTGSSKYKSVSEFLSEKAESLLQNSTFEGIDNYISFFYPITSGIQDYMDSPLVILDEPSRLRERNMALLDEFAVMYEEAASSNTAVKKQGELMLGIDEIFFAAMKDKMLTVQNIVTDESIHIKKIIRFDGSEAPVYRGKFNMLKTDLARWSKMHYNVVFLTGSESRAKRLEETLSDFEVYVPVIINDRLLEEKERAIVPSFLNRGFICDKCSLVLLSEYELFGASRTKPKAKAKKKKQLEVFNDLEIGDYAVHETHGIGIYKGVVSLLADNFVRDYIKIIYSDDNILYVPVEQMDRVEKYIGKDGAKPKINKLGTKQWQNTKARAKAAVDEMAQELMELYASRSVKRGFEFAIDDNWQKQFEDSFIYEETPDQLTCINDIKEDMESSKIMDRLLCGDVGYGKTEVALRAVFKAAMNKKQSAILCPTTILTHQHYETMKRRFADFPIEFAELSRFLSDAEAAKVLRGAASGKIDVVVGTHRLLSNDVKFKDLGLLVVDEEQRFGVTHKEKIKQLKDKVDVLTLTATPIPRTLHMSLSGIRDISILDTPPQERHPVQTFVVEYKESMVRNAIIKEIERGGKVYFLYNRVESISMIAKRLSDLVPEAKIAVAHGQMNEHKLEDTMLGFMEDEYNVLVCTTIIESGLDISSANTLIVYDADKFGLSQLYQLRGRVGRSNRLAYAYFTWREGKVLSEIAEKRLAAIAQFTEFGSGLKIAMRDLEIRGAGDILGARQHGHMATVGYGMYCRMIEEALSGVKGEEEQSEKQEVTLSFKVSAHISEEYIHDQQDRLDIYKKISFIQSVEDRKDIIDELIDRFGQPPEEILNLMDIAYIKHLAQKAEISLIRQTKNSINLKFTDEVNIDGVKLFNLANEYYGKLKISEKDGIVLKYITEDYVPEKIYELLRKVADCKIESYLV
ncbi:MAG: transcription-repair coupling factor [Clostridia bacterium]|nr:transcription-repair coupling factor [Clostridia bacterium]